MRQTQFFAPTLRQVKSDNEGHALLLRGGYLRQVSAGIYSFLPLGWRVLRKIEAIVREEMDRAGAIELLMPALSPKELWAETGRDKLDILFTLQDSKGADYLLAPTHEEVITDIVRSGVSSYKQLPVNLYQIQTKFRDEARPRAGLLRGREFVMKDAYSFDIDLKGLHQSFNKMVAAYSAIFTRCGLPFQIVDAAGGGIGGFDTQEFMVISPSGEDTMLYCPQDGYAANLELATSNIEAVPDRDDIGDDLQKFATPGILTIEALASFEGGARAEHQIKTLVYIADDQPVLLLLRGDHQLNHTKAQTATGAQKLRAATPEEVFDLLGAHPGSLGAVGVSNAPIYADSTLEKRVRMTTGANEDGFHLRGVHMERDIPAKGFFDLREAKAGEQSPRGGGVLQAQRCIEVGHVFKLGNKYSRAMNATFLDQNGKSQIIEMGCYGIGVSRIAACIAELQRDERGPIWPPAIAPFGVHLLLLEKEESLVSLANSLYEKFKAADFDILFDDRNERPGSKFADADLIGAPVRVIVGKAAREGQIEIKSRDGSRSVSVAPEEVLNAVRGF